MESKLTNWFSDVYFFRVESLAEKLSAGVVSDYQAPKHFLLFTIIFSFSYEFPYVIYPESSFSDGLISSLASASIHAVGIIWVFQRFQKGGQQEFFKRYAALSFPISVCIMLFFLPAALLLLSVMNSTGSWNNNPVLSEALVVLLESAYAVIFYRWLSSAITFNKAGA
tara:strand:- start:597 stop:1100 length:504 start_codon:yes stop_codon:yes gene_type:complete